MEAPLSNLELPNNTYEENFAENFRASMLEIFKKLENNFEIFYLS